MARLSLLVFVFLITVPLMACGGGASDMASIDDESSPYEWDTISVTGSSGSFQLPKPFESRAEDGAVIYAVELEDGIQIWVTVLYRGGLEVGSDVGDTLAAFEEKRLTFQTNLLEEEGFTSKISYEKELPVEDGVGQQIRVTFGDQFILNQFYVAKSNFYHVRIKNGDESNAVVKKFLSTIKL